jgi:rhamnogalacturonyl hydrolase YesR
VLTSVYEATGDKKLLDATKEFVDGLIEEQEPDGKFAIKNASKTSGPLGVAISGLRRYYEIMGDEKVLAAMKKLADRALGFEPDFAGRTIDGFLWFFEKTGDQKYAAAAEKSWQATQEHARKNGWSPCAVLNAARYLAAKKGAAGAQAGK